MTKAKEKQPPFDLCADHPVLDFVNSLNHRFHEAGPTELLENYGDFLRFVEQANLLTPPQVRQLANAVNSGAGVRALRVAKELREAIANVLYCKVNGNLPDPSDIRTLERYFHNTSRHRELQWEQPEKKLRRSAKLRWHRGRFETNPDLPVWILSEAASQLMTSDEIDRVRACGAETCRWLFLDTSKNHTRRWCNMKVCGNRMKARRFQARRVE